MADLDYKIDIETAKALRDLKKLLDGLKKTEKQTKQNDSAFKKFGSSLGGMKTVIAGIAGTAGLGALVKNSLATADALGKVADKVGVTVEELQELRFAAEQSGIGAKTLDTSLQRFARRVGEAAKGTGVLYKEFKSLNIPIQNVDGSMRTTNDIFNDYTAAIASTTSQQEKLRLAFAAFDSEGAGMVNMLANGTEGLVAMRKEAHDLNAVIGRDQVDAATRAQDAWGRVRAAFSGIAAQLSLELAPALEEVANNLANAFKDKERVEKLAAAMKVLGDGIIFAADAVGVLSEHIGTLAKVFVALKLAKWLGLFASFKGSVANAGPAILALVRGTGTWGAVLSKTLIPLGVLALRVTALGTAIWVLYEVLSKTGVIKEFAQDLGLIGRTVEEQMAEVQNALDSPLQRLRFFSDKGIIHIYSREELEAELARLKTVEDKTKQVSDVFDEEGNRRIEAIKASANDLANSFSDIKIPTDGFRVLQNEADAAAKKADEVKSAFESALQFLPDNIQLQYEYAQAAEVLKKALDAGAITQQQYNTALAQAKVNLQTAIDETRKLAYENSAVGKAQKESRNELTRIRSSYKPILTAQQKLVKDQTKLNELLKKGHITQKEFNEAMVDMKETQAELAQEAISESRRWSDGWKRAFDEYADNATNAAQRAESIFSTATRSMEDAIVDFAKTGKFNLKSVVADIAEENLRQQIRVVFSKLGGALGGSSSGGSSGGILDSIGSLLGFGGSSKTGSSGAFGSVTTTNPLPVYIVGGSAGGLTIPGAGTGTTTQSGGITSTIGNIFTGIKNTVGNIFTGVTNTVKKIPETIGNVLGSISKGIGNIFGGFFATGGRVPSGKFGIVGESGAELVRGPATVNPLNNKNNSGGNIIQMTINAVDAMSFKQLVARDPAFIHAVAMQGAKGYAG